MAASADRVLKKRGRLVWRIVPALLALILLGTTETSGQMVTAPREHFFGIEWRRLIEGQRHAIAGYVHNPYRHPITAVQVRVEIFDESGQPMGEAHAAMAGDVLPGDRGHFVVPVPDGGGTFGVTVHSFTFVSVESP